MKTATPQPLIFSPPARGEFTWSENDTVLTFTPDEGFETNRNYSVTLNASVHSRSGVEFAATQRWQVRTQNTPQISHRVPSSSTVAERQPSFELLFNRTMVLDSVEAALSVSPVVDYSLDWEGHTLNLEEPLAFATEYTFSIAKTAVDENGSHLAQPYTWTIQLAEPLNHVAWPMVTNHLGPIVLQFNYPVDIDQLQAVMEIEPAISGKLELERGLQTGAAGPRRAAARRHRLHHSLHRAAARHGGRGAAPARTHRLYHAARYPWPRLGATTTTPPTQSRFVLIASWTPQAPKLLSRLSRLPQAALAGTKPHSPSARMRGTWLKTSTLPSPSPTRP